MNQSKFSSYLFSIALFLLLANSFVAQSVNWISTWEPDKTVFYHSSVSDPNGNIYTSAYTWDEGTQFSAIEIIKVSSSGSVVWEKSIKLSTGFFNDTKMFYANLNDKLYVWHDKKVTVFSSSGDSLTSFTVNYGVNDRIFVDDEENVFVTFTGTEHEGGAQGFGAAKFSPAGLLIWDSVLREVSNGRIMNSEMDSHKNIYLMGNEYTQTGTKGVVIKLNENGFQHWQNEHTGYDELNDITLGTDNSVYITGMSNSEVWMLSRYDSTGVLSWNRFNTNPQSTHEGISLKQTPSGILLAASDQVPPIGNVLLLYHYSSTGDLLLTYEPSSPAISFYYDGYGDPNGIYMHYDGNIYVSTNVMINNLNHYALTKVNSSGELIGYSYIEAQQGYFYSSLREAFHKAGSITQVISEPNPDGNGGRIKYINFPTTITSVEDEETVQKEFSLSQNYPNPFNPTTTINFSIPEYQFITLKVYDIIGREVKSLVNETKSPGTYEIEFDGSDLSSGTYYYKLTMGSHFEIRKMVLLK